MACRRRRQIDQSLGLSFTNASKSLRRWSSGARRPAVTSSIAAASHAGHDAWTRSSIRRIILDACPSTFAPCHFYMTGRALMSQPLVRRLWYVGGSRSWVPANTSVNARYPAAPIAPPDRWRRVCAGHVATGAGRTTTTAGGTGRSATRHPWPSPPPVRTAEGCRVTRTYLRAGPARRVSSPARLRT